MKPNLYVHDEGTVVNLNLIALMKLDTSGRGAEVRLITETGRYIKLKFSNDKDARNCFYEIWEAWMGEPYTARA